MKTTKCPALIFTLSLLVGMACPAWANTHAVSDPAASTSLAPDTATAQWDGVKNSTFDQREKYFAGLKKLVEIVDAEADDLTAKRRQMSNRSETVDWDLAIKEFMTTRDYLKSLSREATKATVKEWDQTKEKISQAWSQTQSAYDKARLSTPK